MQKVLLPELNSVGCCLHVKCIMTLLSMCVLKPVQQRTVLCKTTVVCSCILLVGVIDGSQLMDNVDHHFITSWHKAGQFLSENKERHCQCFLDLNKTCYTKKWLTAHLQEWDESAHLNLRLSLRNTGVRHYNTNTQTCLYFISSSKSQKGNLGIKWNTSFSIV